MIALILLFLTAPIQYLPSAVLGAVIVFAALKLIDLAQWRALIRSGRAEVAIAAITAVVVVSVGVLQAIVVAVALSVADIIRRAARPADAVLGWSAEEDRYVDVRDHPEAGITAGVVVYRIQDRMFFANAHFFKRRLWAAVDGAPKPVHHVILDASSISDIDASGQVALREVVGGLSERNISLSVARATVELRLHLDRVGLTEAIGPGNFHGTVAAAVDAATRHQAPHPDESARAAGLPDSAWVSPGRSGPRRPQQASWTVDSSEAQFRPGSIPAITRVRPSSAPIEPAIR